MDDSEENDLRHEIARSNYGGMLHDKERNRKYKAALCKTIRKMLSNNMEVLALDIGTGTGLLAMMAAEGGAQKVVACESFQPMANAASKILKRNSRMEVELINKCSFDLNISKDTSLKRKPNLLVTEIFDTELIGEGVLPTLRHAHGTLLEENSFTVPAAAEAIVQMISSASLWRCHKLEGNTTLLGQHDNMKNCRGIASPYEVHIDKVSDLRCLSDPLSVVRFDFSKPHHHTGKDDAEAASFSFELKSLEMTRDGRMHALLFWWKLYLDLEGSVVLEMTPQFNAKPDIEVTWRDHWMQAVYFLPEAIDVMKGERLDLLCCYDDYSFWFDVRRSSRSEKTMDVIPDRPLCNCGLHLIWSREKFRMHNSPTIRNAYGKATKNIRRCICIGEMSLLPYILLENGLQEIIYVECSMMSMSFEAQLLPKSSETLKVIRSNGLISSEQLKELCSSTEVDAIVADVMLSCNLLPWHSLSMWQLFWSLHDSVSMPLMVIPDKAVLKGAAVHFDHLWKVAAPVGMVEGFNMSDFDNLIQSAFSPQETAFGPLTEVNPYPLWEYDVTFRSDCFSLMEFDAHVPIVEEGLFHGTYGYNSDGECHGVALWMEFWSGNSMLYTTGLEVETDRSKRWVDHNQQGVFFFPIGKTVINNEQGTFRVYFNPQSGHVMFHFS